MNLKVIADNLKFAEEPVFLEQGDIFLVELERECITYIERKNFTKTNYHVGGMPNGMVVKDMNTLLFCDAWKNQVCSFNMIDKSTTVITDRANGQVLRGHNDLIIDRFGNILFTCPGGSAKSPIGYIC